MIFQKFIYLLLVAFFTTSTACSDERITPPPSPESSVNIVKSGSDEPVSPELNGPSIYLMGKGMPALSSYEYFLDILADSPVDITVLAGSAASGSSATPECDLLMELDQVNSCTTATVQSEEEANSTELVETIDQSEAIYFAGGNQCVYVNWRDTQLHDAINTLVERGGGIGGGSAGLAIQGDMIYDGCRGSVRSEEALSDPYHEYISLSEGMFELSSLNHTITDSHFSERERLGRLISFMARITSEKEREEYFGIGLDDNTSVVLNSSGTGKVFGGYATRLKTTEKAQQAEEGRPVTIYGVERIVSEPGETINMNEFNSEQAGLIDVENGEVFFRDEE
jgi:cyanophycinase